MYCAKKKSDVFEKDIYIYIYLYKENREGISQVIGLMTQKIT